MHQLASSIIHKSTYSHYSVICSHVLFFSTFQRMYYEVADLHKPYANETDENVHQRLWWGECFLQIDYATVMFPVYLDLVSNFTVSVLFIYLTGLVVTEGKAENSSLWFYCFICLHFAIYKLFNGRQCNTLFNPCDNMPRYW